MRGLALLIVLLMPLQTRADQAPSQAISHLRVRPHAVFAGEIPTLADVLTFDPDDVALRELVGQEPVWSQPEIGVATCITHDQVEQRLRDLGVDLSRILLGGATTCRLTRKPADSATDPTPPPPLARPAPLAARPTLAATLKRHVDGELASLGGTAELEFEQASGQFLDLTSPPFEFLVQPQGRGKLGLREFRVTVRRDGKTQRTVSVFARVRLSREVLVASRPLSVGTFVARDAVELQPRVFEREEDLGPQRIEEAVGQQVARFVPTGQMIRPGDLKSVELVQRSRPVTVLGPARNVQVKLTGVALESGGYGETVRVRLGEARQSRNVVRAIVTGPGTVRVTEDG